MALLKSRKRNGSGSLNRRHPHVFNPKGGRRPGWCDAIGRNSHRRYRGRFTRLANLARSLIAPTAAGLLLASLFAACTQAIAQISTVPNITSEGPFQVDEGGADSDHFSIDSPPGVLRFTLDAIAPRIFSEPPDFEAPVDGDAANTYEPIRVTDASGAGTTYVVHCLSNVFFDIETVTYPGADPLEDLILFNRDGYFTLMDRNGVPRHRRAYSPLGGFAMRFYRIGVDGAYRYGIGQNGPTVLDEDFEVVEDNVTTVGSSLRPINPHDFQILENGNYLLTANQTVTGDFRDFDLSSSADTGVDLFSVAVWDQTVQILTPGPGAQAVFTWGAWGNIAVEDCVQHRFPVTLSTDPFMRSPAGGYAHINGVRVVDGVLAASMRGCSKVLGIDVEPGATRETCSGGWAAPT